MAKNAYLIVTDLHVCHKSLTNRLDYRAEIAFVNMELIKTARKYRVLGYKVTLLLLGDVYHNSYQSVFNAITDSNFFVMWKKSIGDIYSVVGNHELSYYDSNPFYTLVTEIESDKLKSVTDKVWAPIGTMSTIKVLDRLDDGEVHFHFNHYSTNISQVKEVEGINIGLFHQEIVCDSIITAMEAALQGKVFAKTTAFDNTDILDGYRYCFFGHMHKVYGTWLNEHGTYLCYLASLGRTNETEVSDNFLDRNLPVVLVDDGKLLGVEENKITLQARKECVNETYVEKAKATYNTVKQKNEFKKYTPLGDDPVQNLKSLFSTQPKCLRIFEGLLQDSVEPLGEAIIEKCRRKRI